MEFWVLGEFEVRSAGVPVDVGHARQRAVLAVLVLGLGRVVPAGELIDRVWGDDPPASVRNVLYGYVARLRAVIARAADPAVSLSRQPGGYRLDAGRDQVDLYRFRRLLADASAAGGDEDRAGALLAQAVALWRGPALAGLDSPWLNGMRESLEAQRRTAVLDLADIRLRQGQHHVLAASLAEEAVTCPADERLAGQLMLALYRSGRQAEALHRYEQTRQRLADELGADPGPPLQALHRQILTADPALAVPVSERPGLPGLVTGSPYRGLSVFQEQDAALFFGREVCVAQVLERLSRSVDDAGLLMVSGVSGAGKSSLLRAGVLARLKTAGLAAAPGSTTWPCLVFTPARAPLDELALRVALLAGADAAAVRRGLDTDARGFALTVRQAALARPSGSAADPGGCAAELGQRERRVVLVVDQFEQVFTQCAEESQRRAFIAALHAAATFRQGPDQEPAALVMLAVRADYEARCADYPQLAGAVQDRYLVTAMTGRQLRMAITEPARRAGSGVEDSLADVLLSELRIGLGRTTGAGALPLLSHALDQAWRARAGETLGLADYERVGGIERALATSAQRIYDSLTRAQQAAARQVLLRLTASSSDGTDIAVPASRAQLTEGTSTAEAEDVAAVLEAFAAGRLLTLDAASVEISHEVLLSAWPLLRDTWLADTHADRIARNRLHAVATEWARHAHDPSYLYAGSLLYNATEAAARISADPSRHPPLSTTERHFLDASHGAHRRSTRRRHAFAVLLAALAGLAFTTVVSIHASEQAARQRDIAVSGQLISESDILSHANPAIAMLLSIAAWRINPSTQARYALLAAAARPGIPARTWPTRPVRAVAFSPDGKVLASVTAYGIIQLRNPATGRLITTLPPGYVGPVTTVAFSPDGKALASGTADGTIQLWNLATRRVIRTLPSRHASPATTIAFSPDGTLASGSADGTVQLWQPPSYRPIGSSFARPAHRLTPVAFSPDGRTLASGSATGIHLRDVLNGRQTGSPLTGHAGAVTSLAFSPQAILATGNANGYIQLWDITTGHPIGGSFTGHAGAVVSLAFSPHAILVTGSANGQVQLWDVPTRQQIGNALNSPISTPTWVTFSPDGKTLVGGSANGIRSWNTAATANPVPYLCAAAERPFTPADWRRYIPAGPRYQKICP